MTTEITVISPESLEIANAYLQFGTVRLVTEHLGLNPDVVVAELNKSATKRYIDTVYLDLGYRNRNTIGALLDEMIESKLEEARETSIYTTKDLADLLAMAHKMKMDEIKAQNEALKTENAALDRGAKTQINVSAGGNGFGEGNYGILMGKLLGED